MSVGRFRKRLILLVSALVGVLALALVAVVFGLVDLVPDPGPASIFGWAVPLVALFVIIGVTWLLLARDSDEPVEDGELYAVCPSCGQSVLSDWRLCPYCGAQQRDWRTRGTDVPAS